VFFDVLTFGIVRWPLHWMPVLALVAVLLLVAGAARAMRRGQLRAEGVGWGLVGFVIGVLGTAAAGVLVSVALRAVRAVPYAWVAHPAFVRGAFLGLPVLATGVAAMWVARRAAAPPDLWWGAWAAWAIAA